METVFLTIGVVGMLIGTLTFGGLALRAPEGSRYFFVITALITLIAFISYLAMATGEGSTIVGTGDQAREFYYWRYIDWVFTTPLLLLDLALLALVRPRQSVGLISTIVVLDVVMILLGLWAGATAGAGRYVLWGLSTVAMIVLLYIVVTRLFAAANEQSPAVQTVFRTLAALTVVLWSLYPVVWLIGEEGFGAVGTSGEVGLFLILDLLAKVGFGFILLSNRQALTDIGRGGTTQAQASRVS